MTALFKLIRLKTKYLNTQKCLKHNLSFDLYGDKVHPHDKDRNMICFMHGLLGSKRHWRTPALKWKSMFPQFSCMTFDHRGHGASSHVHKLSSSHHYPENDIKSCAYDLIHLIQSENMKPPKIIVAHSFSGKVALQYVLEAHDLVHNPENSSMFQEPEHTWLVDTGPGVLLKDNSSQEISNEWKKFHHIIDTLNKVPTVFSSKEWMINELVNKYHIDEMSVVSWIATHIIPVSHKSQPFSIQNTNTTTSQTNHNSIVPNQFTWGFNLQTINDLFNNYKHTDMWDVLEKYNGNSTIHFIRAGKNNLIWTKDVLDKFEYLQKHNRRIKLHMMPHVGHWVHIDDLNGMLDLIARHSGLVS